MGLDIVMLSHLDSMLIESQSLRGQRRLSSSPKMARIFWASVALPGILECNAPSLRTRLPTVRHRDVQAVERLGQKKWGQASLLAR